MLVEKEGDLEKRNKGKNEEENLPFCYLINCQCFLEKTCWMIFWFEYPRSGSCVQSSIESGGPTSGKNMIILCKTCHETT